MPMSEAQEFSLWLRMLAEREVRFARGINGYFNRLSGKIKTAFENEGQALAEIIIEESFMDLSRVLIANYAVVTRDFAQQTARVLQNRKATFEDIAREFISREGLNKAKQINVTTKKIVRKVIIKGQTEGLSNVKIARNISKATAGKIGRVRSLTIAITETHNAACYAAQAQAEALDVEVVRKWVSAEDDRTRPAHADKELLKQVRRIDEPFYVGGEYIMTPREGSAANAIRCRCKLKYIPKY